MGGTIYRLPIIPNVSGDYINPAISVDRYGRIINITNGSGGVDGVPYIGATGNVDLGMYQINTANVTVQIQDSGSNGLIISGHSDQLAPLQIWQDSASNTLSYIDYTGNPHFPSLDVTNNSTALPTILAKSGYVGISSTSYRNSPATHVLFEGKAARGSYDAPAIINSGDSLFRISAAGWDGSSFYTPGVDNAATIDFKADSDFSGPFNRSAIISFETMASGDNFRTRRGHIYKNGFRTNYAYNNVWITEPATSGRLTILEGSHLTASGNTTVSGNNTGDQDLAPYALTASLGDLALVDFVDLSSQATGILPNSNTTGTSVNTPNTLVLRNSSGYATVDISGSASTADSLTTARLISFSGDLDGSGAFDGSADLSINIQITPSSIVTSDINGSSNIILKPIVATFDGGGSVLTTGYYGFGDIPYDCVIQSYRLLADQSGDLVIDVWKTSYANYPPTSGDSIVGSEHPTLSNEIKSEDTSLTTWSSSISAGDVLGFNIDSVSGVQYATLSIKVKLI